MTTRVTPNCGAGGIVVDTLESPSGSSQEQAELGAEILTLDADGQLAWTTVPIDSMPPDSDGVRTIDVIDGYLTVEIALEPRDPLSDARPTTSLYLWVDGQWEVLSDDVASWPIGTGHDLRVRTVIVADRTAVLAFDHPLELGEPAVFRIYE